MNASANAVTASSPTYCVDLAKHKFQAHTFGVHAERLQQRTLTRGAMQGFFGNPRTPRGRVIMEACASAHYWARWLMARGYQVTLLPAQFVAQHRIGNRTDGNDADAIYATSGDKRVRPVPVKSIEQQDACAWHRLRERLIDERTACINQARGLLAERGCVAGKSRKGFAELMAGIHAQPQGEITRPLLQMLELIGERIAHINEQLQQIEAELKAQLAQSPIAQALDTVLGVGVVIATAVAAETGGNVARYADARQFAASLGITPKETSSGQSRRLVPITKRGNAYLRRLLVQGAQSLVCVSARRDDALCVLAQRLFAQGKRRNTVIVAIANRMARVIYAVIKHGQPYQAGGRHRPVAAAPNLIPAAALA